MQTDDRTGIGEEKAKGVRRGKYEEIVSIKIHPSCKRIGWTWTRSADVNHTVLRSNNESSFIMMSESGAAYGRLFRSHTEHTLLRGVVSMVGHVCYPTRTDKERARKREIARETRKSEHGLNMRCGILCVVWLLLLLDYLRPPPPPPLLLLLLFTIIGMAW